MALGWERPAGGVLRLAVLAAALWSLGDPGCARAAGSVGAAESNRLRAEQTVGPRLPATARWNLVAIDLATGREAVAAGSDPGRPMAPGSLVKLFIAGAALDHAQARGGPGLGTRLSHDGVIRDGVLSGNLYLSGRGNALFSVADLGRMVDALAGQGVTRVAGDVVADDAFLDARGLERSRAGAAYAEPGALGLDLHTSALTAIPDEMGSPPKVTVEPVNDEVRIALESRTTVLASRALRITRLDDLAYRVAGNIVQGAAASRMRFALAEPALYAAGTLRTLLRRQGIEVLGTLRKGETPADTRTIAEAMPPELDRLLRDMNVNSLNVVADNLLLVLGAERFGPPGTRDKGVRALQGFLEGLGLAADAAVIADGSGLSGANRVSAGFVARYLQRAASLNWFERFYASLPRPGLDGTLRDLDFSDQRFRAKTGTLEDAYALAGYGVDRNGKPLAFAFIVNHPGAGVLDLKRAGTAVMRYLSTEVSL